MEVELVALDPHQITRRPGDEHARLRVGLERLPQARHVALEDGAGGGGHRLAPELVEQHVGRHDLVRVQEQDREHGSLLRAAERDRAIAGRGLDRAEEPEREHLVPKVTACRPAS